MRWDQWLFWSCYGATCLMLGYTLYNISEVDWITKHGFMVISGWVLMSAFLWTLVAVTMTRAER